MVNKTPFVYKATAFLLFLILIVVILLWARSILYPLAFAILLSYLIYPLVNSFEKLGIPRIAANLLGIILSLSILGGFVFLLIRQLRFFATNFPHLREQAYSNIEKLNNWIESVFGVAVEAQKTWLQSTLSNIFNVGSVFLADIFSATTGTIGAIGILPVYIFFMLFYRNKFQEFILKWIPQEQHYKTKTILYEVSLVTKRYMVGIVIVVLILSILNSLGMVIIGITYPILFGILSALLNFIPYFGTLIGGILPLLFALLFEGTPGLAIYVVIYFIAIQFVENNILTPNIVGGNLSLNPFLTILSIITGSWLWGIPGMFMSVPYMAMFKIFCDHVKELHPIGFMLGTKGTEEHSITAKKIKKLFQRKRTQ